MKTSAAFFWGVLGGAGLQALLDPRQGRRRRALLRDAVVRAREELFEGSGALWRDLSQRASGLAAETFRIAEEEPPSDEVLHERVRARLGRLVSHPRAIEVRVRDGTVGVSGSVLRRESRRLLAGVARVPGVRRVEDLLDPHDEPGNVPALQGRGVVRPQRLEWLREDWSPGMRASAAAVGAALALWGATRRGWLRGPASAVGAALVTRAVRNRPLREIATGFAGAERAARAS